MTWSREECNQNLGGYWLDFKPRQGRLQKIMWIADGTQVNHSYDLDMIILTWVSLTLGVGYLFTAAPAKCSRCSLPGRGVSPHRHPS